MVGDIVRVCLFVFAFVQSMTIVLVSKGPNLPEPRLFDACSIQTPWTTMRLAVDCIVSLVRMNGDEFEVVGNCAFVARLLQRVF